MIDVYVLLVKQAVRWHNHNEKHVWDLKRDCRGLSARARVCVCVSSSALLLRADLTFQSILWGSFLIWSLSACHRRQLEERKRSTSYWLCHNEATCFGDSFNLYCSALRNDSRLSESIQEDGGELMKSDLKGHCHRFKWPFFGVLFCFVHWYALICFMMQK